jgi:hypothetical protein
MSINDNFNLELLMRRISANASVAFVLCQQERALVLGEMSLRLRDLANQAVDELERMKNDVDNPVLEKAKKCGEKINV